MNTHPKNPYIGPRTFLREEGELFFGRDREGRDVGALIASERLVVFYAQSGAGKSSIVNTRLIPDMENNRYEVLPVGRVSGEVSEGVHTGNIYIYNLMRSLIQHETDPNDIAGLSLSQFLGCLNADENGYFYDNGPLPDPSSLEGLVPWRRALVIDQFEEIFSTHNEAWDKRKDFFVQLAQAIENDPYLWVVLVMREDYIAHLDPYAHLLPTGLRVRYYMQRLSREAALNAVKRPAEKAGRPYAKGVAEKLVDDLSSIKVQNVDGSTGTLPGQFVEAVQLQVVCFSLWENLSGGTEITEEDLKVIGNVDDALGKYYADRVAGVAKAKRIKERTLREWIEKKMIASGGIRNMVLQETGKTTDGVSDNVIQALQSDLVRAENRGGAVWYELTHDRLVEPILEDNKKWFDLNLSPLQRQATLWNDQERNESWLLRDAALADVEKWASENLDEVTELETKFLEACRGQQAQIQSKLDQKARETRRLRQFTIVASILTVIALITAVFAFRSYSLANHAKLEAEQSATIAFQAEENAKAARDAAIQSQNEAKASEQKFKEQASRALAGSLASQANLQTTEYPLALLMSVEAYRRDDNILTRTTLFNLLQNTPYQQSFDFNSAVTSVAVSPDGKWIAAASCSVTNPSSQQCSKGGFKILNSDNFLNDAKESTASSDFGVVYSMIFFEYEDRLILATGGCALQGCSRDAGQITLWEIGEDGTPGLINIQVDSGLQHSGLVKTLAFNADRNLLASGSYDTVAVLWDLSDLSRPRAVARLDHDSFVNSVAFNSDGTTLASAGDDRIIYLWDISKVGIDSNLKFVPNKTRQHTAPVTSVAFSPDDSKLASASDDRSIFIWNFNPDSHSLQGAPIKLEGHAGYIKSITFNKDGTMLASAGFDNKIILWDTSNTDKIKQIGPPLDLHSGVINGIAFGINSAGDKEAPFLVSVSDDRSAIKWDLTARNPVSSTFLWGSADTPVDEGQLDARVNGQQISLLDPSNDGIFLVINTFNSRVRRVGSDAGTLLTAELSQSVNDLDTEETIGPDTWVTEWIIDPEEWVTRACAAVNQAKTPEQIEQYRTANPDLQNACK